MLLRANFFFFISFWVGVNTKAVNDRLMPLYYPKAIPFLRTSKWHVEATVEQNPASPFSHGAIAATALDVCYSVWRGETAAGTGADANLDSLSFAQLTSPTAVDAAQSNLQGPDVKPPGLHEPAVPEGFAPLADVKAVASRMSPGSSDAMSSEAPADGTSPSPTKAVGLEALAGGTSSGLQTPTEFGAPALRTAMDSVAGKTPFWTGLNYIQRTFFFFLRH